MATRLTFHGGAGTVTGSCYQIEHDHGRFLIDCGMFQGTKTVRELNYGSFPFEPDAIDFVLLTHAHIDHSGLLPKLSQHGFERTIHATEPTVDLLSFMLPDSGHIQESEVERLNRRNRRRGRAAGGARVRRKDAGHILGSASIELRIDDGAGQVHLLFSGDLGPDEKVFHLEPDAPAGFDYVVCESTYGDRDRADATVEERRRVLCDEINAALAAGGNLLVPAFAVERTQELLHDIGVLMAQRRIKGVPVFLDSPLANNATQVFTKHAAALEDIALDENELFRNPNFRFVESVDESKSINQITAGAIIIAASGMCDAGRIRHHLKNNLWRAKATVLFVGYQAPGTLGRLILDGEQSVRMFGDEVAVKARIRQIGNYSAHADQKELVDWVVERRPVHGGIFLTHGEDQAREALREHLIAAGCQGALMHLPKIDDSFELVAAAAPAAQPRKARIPDSEIARDWHNDYAVLLLDLSRQLQRLPSDRARRQLLRRLHGELPA